MGGISGDLKGIDARESGTSLLKGGSYRRQANCRVTLKNGSPFFVVCRSGNVDACGGLRESGGVTVRTLYRAERVQILLKMATSTKLVSMDRCRPSSLTSELKDFIDRAIVPALVKQYLAEANAENKLAKRDASAAHSVSKTAAPELRTVRP
jgi:hypothetical protein